MSEFLDFNSVLHTPNQLVEEFKELDISLYIKREDLIHPEVSGNKFRKLKYNIKEAKSRGKKVLLTFGGAYSNHIAATAAAGMYANMKTIGVIRGDELAIDFHKTLESNPTLKFAVSCGMDLYFVSREEYREKEDLDYIQFLYDKFGDFCLIPEGGTNAFAVKGCEEILNPEDADFDVVCCSVGTGGTISGLINASKKHQRILGFPALKGDFLRKEVEARVVNENWSLNTNYHFGGYAKVNKELISFINQFKKKYAIPLDPIYTGKLLFGIFDLLEKGYFQPGSKILAIHTGGLQGISGMNTILKKKNLPLINI